jgi:hypothetical protein
MVIIYCNMQPYSNYDKHKSCNNNYKINKLRTFDNTMMNQVDQKKETTYYFYINLLINKHLDELWQSR